MQHWKSDMMRPQQRQQITNFLAAQSFCQQLGNSSFTFKTLLQSSNHTLMCIFVDRPFEDSSMRNRSIADLREFLDSIATQSLEMKADVHELVPIFKNLKDFFEFLATKKQLHGGRPLGRLFSERVDFIITSFQENRTCLREHLDNIKELHESLGKLSVEEVEDQKQQLLAELDNQYQCVLAYYALVEEQLKWFQVQDWPWLAPGTPPRRT